MLKNLKVRSKLFFSYCIILLFYIIAVIAALIGLRSVFGGLENFYRVPYPMVQSALEAQSATKSIQADVYRASLAGTDSEVQSILSGIEQTSATLMSALDTLENTYEGDEALLQETNGIVQGMSGSPILQNGKLIGAVTHVFVNDSTKGYGIFIENMLEN